jgi:uncharacterized protein (TIGR02265 family)
MGDQAAGPARIKGVVLIARLRWLGERADTSQVERVLRRLPRDDEVVLRGQLLHVAWYPLQLKLRLDEAIAAELAGSRQRIFREMGRSSAEINLSGPHEAYVRSGDPHALLSRAPHIYRSGNEAGYRSYEKVGPSTAVVRTFDAAAVSPSDCLTALGWFERAIELCGGRDVRVVETKCRAEGAPCCEYRCDWI